MQAHWREGKAGHKWKPQRPRLLLRRRLPLLPLRLLLLLWQRRRRRPIRIVDIDVQQSAIATCMAVHHMLYMICALGNNTVEISPCINQLATPTIWDCHSINQLATQHLECMIMDGCLWATHFIFTS